MSLLDDVKEPFVLMLYTRIPDGEGGYTHVWEEGLRFEAHKATVSTGETIIAQAQGVASVYSILIPDDLPLRYHDVIRCEDGYFRITSEPNEKKAPNMSTLNMKYCTMEKLKVLPE